MKKKVLILFIDEANRLRSLLRNKDGQAALESLFQWLQMRGDSFMLSLQVVIALPLIFMGGKFCEFFKIYNINIRPFGGKRG